MPRTSPRFLALAACLLLPLAGCDDAPTGPTSYVQDVAGSTWVAITEPAGMASLEAWMPFLETGTPEARAVLGLRERAGRARSAGRVEEGAALEAEAFTLAATALREPPLEKLLGGLAALDSWTDRAGQRAATGTFPALAGATRYVRAQADSARASLERGDTSAALGHLARGTVAAREHSPVMVGLRLLATLDAWVAAAPETPGVVRARRLVVGAREGLATGDSIRALKRAVYALQLLEAEAPGAAPQTVDSGVPPR